MSDKAGKQNRIGRPRLITLDAVEPQPVEWLWPGKFAIGKVSSITGDPGLGKSLITLDAIARVSRGMRWPDSDEPNVPGTSILLQAEDDAPDVIRPRLDAAGGDPGKVVVLDAVEWYDGERHEPTSRMFTLEHDLKALEEAIDLHADTRLVVIDPVSAYLGKKDSHVNSDMRGLLAPLAKLAAERHVAVVLVNHLNKTSGGAAIYRTAGSIALVAAMRSVYAVVKSPHDASTRLFLCVKNNLAKDCTGLSYRITEENGAPCLAWGARPVEMSIDEVLSLQQQPRGGRSAERRKAAEWLRHQLAAGPVASRELQERCKAEGLEWRVVQRAKADMGLHDFKQGFGKGGSWFWSLPDDMASGENGENGENDEPAILHPFDKESDNESGENGNNGENGTTIDTIPAIFTTICNGGASGNNEETDLDAVNDLFREAAAGEPWE